uniref:Uncharacterized protein n=1 Tax=Zooxanthella nutricula TaxID=1333877 RepID=A0A7S2NM10_9DINO
MALGSIPEQRGTGRAEAKRGRFSHVPWGLLCLAACSDAGFVVSAPGAASSFRRSSSSDSGAEAPAQDKAVQQRAAAAAKAAKTGGADPAVLAPEQPGSPAGGCVVISESLRRVRKGEPCVTAPVAGSQRQCVVNVACPRGHWIFGTDNKTVAAGHVKVSPTAVPEPAALFAGTGAEAAPDSYALRATVYDRLGKGHFVLQTNNGSLDIELGHVYPPEPLAVVRVGDRAVHLGAPRDSETFLRRIYGSEWRKEATPLAANHMDGYPKLPAKCPSVKLNHPQSADLWEDFAEIVFVLNAAGIEYHMAAGTVLGWYRDCVLCMSGDDIDFTLPLHAFKDAESAFLEPLKSRGWKQERTFGARGHLGFEMAMRAPRTNVKFDLFSEFFGGGNRHFNSLWIQDLLYYCVERMTHVGVQIVNGIPIFVPEDWTGAVPGYLGGDPPAAVYESYLKSVYGDNWRVPAHGWRWDTSPFQVGGCSDVPHGRTGELAGPAFDTATRFR